MSEENQKIQFTINHFHESFQSLVLGTLTNDSLPFTSYAPFVKYENKYYFLISKIAQHYANLLANPSASMMMIEDESKAKNIFFRKRLSYAIETKLDVDIPEVRELFISQFGEMVSQLFKMNFIVVECHIKYGHIIVGPGQAYQIDKNQEVISQLTGIGGHGHTKS